MKLLVVFFKMVHIDHFITLGALFNVPETVGEMGVDFEGGELAMAVLAGL